MLNRNIPLLLVFTLCLGPGFNASAQTDAPRTGEFDLTITERSPQSAPKELARRFNIPEKEITPDYDVAKCPFKIYVPTNYNPATPLGIFVFLSYKDSEMIPQGWGPALDEMHMIFVTPVCHSGQQYAPAVPLWQVNGLALDVVASLKRQYKIQEDRVYLMTVDHVLQTCLGLSDVFTGFAPVGVGDFYKKLKGANGGFYLPKLAQPAPLLQLAQSRGFFLIYGSQPDNSDSLGIVSAAMPREGFRHTTIAVLSMHDEVHAPNLAIGWFKDKCIPFLDSAVAAEPKAGHPAVATAATKPAAGATSTPAAPVASKAQHQLDMAQLYLTNGQRDLAKSKLQQIIHDYPADPAAKKAQELLDAANKP